MPSFKKIKEDVEMRRMYLDGFSHGYVGISRLSPNILKEIYDLAYDDGMNEKVYRYIEMMNEETKNLKEYVPPTRRKETK